MQTPHEPSAQAVREASYWLMLHWQGELSKAQQQGFHDWLQADAGHQQAWSQLQQLQTLLAQAPQQTSQLLHAPNSSRRSAVKLLGVLLIGGGVLLTQDRAAQNRTPAALTTFAGQRRQLQLEDGSQLWLNTDTRVQLHFDAQQRKILLLSGELYLQSAADTYRPTRPLLVETGDGQVVALGTQFSVRRTDAISRVDLYQGELLISNRAGSRQRLVAGQGLHFSSHGMGDVIPAEHYGASWREGKLIVEHQPLGEFISELQRHRSGVIRCAEALRSIPVTGTFHLDDTDQILALLQQSLPLRVRYFTRYWVYLEAS